MTPTDPPATPRDGTRPGRALDAAVCERVLGWRRDDTVLPYPAWRSPADDGWYYEEELPELSSDPTTFMRLVVPAMRAKGWTWEAQAVADDVAQWAWEYLRDSDVPKAVSQGATITEAGCVAALAALTPDPAPAGGRRTGMSDETTGQRIAAAWMLDTQSNLPWTDLAARIDRALDELDAEQRAALARVTEYAARLFQTLAPDCVPFDDALGLLTQIDNWCAGALTDRDTARTALAQVRAVVESLTRWPYFDENARRVLAILDAAQGDGQWDRLHPNGACVCGGEGNCAWCVQTRLAEEADRG